MFTAPAFGTDPTASNGTPTARSENPSPLKSPTATARPNASLVSALPSTPTLSWLQNWFPVDDSPDPEP